MSYFSFLVICFNLTQGIIVKHLTPVFFALVLAIEKSSYACVDIFYKCVYMFESIIFLCIYQYMCACY